MIGQLRERVTLQGVTATVSAAGDARQSWADTITVWGRMQPESSRSLGLRGAPQEERSYLLTIRHRDGINASMRVRWGTRLFEVKSVKNYDERNRFLVLFLLEREP